MRLSTLSAILRYGKTIFLLTVVVVVAVFIYISTGLVADLSRQERERMEIWADATREIVSSVADDSGAAIDIDFLLRIIESNTTIPVLLTDDEGNILQQRNFDLPEPIDSLNPGVLSQVNQDFLADKLHDLVRVFCFANTISMVNPYFQYFGLTVNTSKRFNIYKEYNNDVIVEIYKTI